MGEPIIVTELTYETEPGRPWAEDMPREFTGMGEATWQALPTVDALVPVYGTCIDQSTDEDGRQVLTFHRVRDGMIFVLTYDGPPLA